MAVFLMDERDFRIPVDTMSNAELYGQVSWARKLCKSSGFKTIDEFQAHEYGVHASVLDRIKTCQDEIQDNCDAFETLLEDQKAITLYLATATDELNAAMEELKLHAESDEDAIPIHENVTISENTMNDARERLTAVTKALRDHKDMTGPYDFHLVYLNQLRLASLDVQAKILRMQSLEQEFKLRTDLARSESAYKAWSTNKPDTWQEPVIPNYLHINTVFGGQDYMVAANFAPDLSEEDLWGW